MARVQIGRRLYPALAGLLLMTGVGATSARADAPPPYSLAYTGRPDGLSGRRPCFKRWERTSAAISRSNVGNRPGSWWPCQTRPVKGRGGRLSCPVGTGHLGPLDRPGAISQQPSVTRLATAMA